MLRAKRGCPPMTYMPRGEADVGSLRREMCALLCLVDALTRMAWNSVRATRRRTTASSTLATRLRSRTRRRSGIAG